MEEGLWNCASLSKGLFRLDMCGWYMYIFDLSWDNRKTNFRCRWLVVASLQKQSYSLTIFKQGLLIFGLFYNSIVKNFLNSERLKEWNRPVDTCTCSTIVILSQWWSVQLTNELNCENQWTIWTFFKIKGFVGQCSLSHPTTLCLIKVLLSLQFTCSQNVGKLSLQEHLLCNTPQDQNVFCG